MQLCKEDCEGGYSYKELAVKIFSDKVAFEGGVTIFFLILILLNLIICFKGNQPAQLFLIFTGRKQTIMGNTDIDLFRVQISKIKLFPCK